MGNDAFIAKELGNRQILIGGNGVPTLSDKAPQGAYYVDLSQDPIVRYENKGTLDVPNWTSSGVAFYTKSLTEPVDTSLLWFKIIDTGPPELIEPYYYDGDVWKSFFSGAFLSQELEVNIGEEAFGIPDLTTFSAGTPVEDLLRQMLRKVIHPTYVAPVETLVGTPPIIVEVGTDLTPELTFSFAQNDAGAAGEIRLYKGAGVLATNPVSPYTEAQYQIGEEVIAYKVQQDYVDGAIKNNNLGDPDPVGQILAGTVESNIVNFEGTRNLFFDVDLPVTSSAEIRLLTNIVSSAVNGEVFDIDIPAGAVSIAFAYRGTLQDVSSVQHVENSFAEVKGVFIRTNITVEGANGYAGITYSVYEYVPAIPYPSDATYRVTI